MTASGPSSADHRFANMLVGLVVLLVGAPLVRDLFPDLAPIVMPVIYGVAILLATLTLSKARVWRAWGLAFALLVALSDWLDPQLSTGALRFAHIVLSNAFFLFAIALTLRQVLFGPTVDLNRVMGALCVYMLFGVFFAYVFWILELLAPGSMKGVAAVGPDALAQQLTYFSFVTLTTLGYGDISPASDLAQSLAFVEALVGQMYMTVLVAGLVGMHIANVDARRHGGSHERTDGDD